MFIKLFTASIFLLLVATINGCGGGEDNTCFEFVSSTSPLARMVQEGRKDHWRSRYFYVYYELISYQVDSEAEIDLLDSQCTNNERKTTQDYIEQTTTCTKGDITVLINGRTYLVDGTVQKAGESLSINAGGVSLGIEVQRAGITNNMKSAKLKAQLRWDFPDRWIEFVFTEVNQYEKSAYDPQNLFNVAIDNSFLRQVNLNGIIKMDMVNGRGVLLCDNASTCDQNPTSLELTGSAGNVKSIKFIQEINIPTSMDLEYKWTGEKPVMKLDPTIVLSKGALVSGWLRSRALFIALAVIISFIVVILMPVLCCVCCIFCKCCGCVKDAICCCFK